MLSQRIRRQYYSTLGTSVIKSLISPYSKSKTPLYLSILVLVLYFFSLFSIYSCLSCQSHCQFYSVDWLVYKLSVQTFQQLICKEVILYIYMGIYINLSAIVSFLKNSGFLFVCPSADKTMADILKLERLDTQLNKPTNQSSLKVSKVIKRMNKKTLLQNFGD